eukprot:gb/GEZJ01003231.1/.p1 GENE.gb/GEZJ01003231.1/~~gb/GEZJ01003231.1/.p1  ORF type:complete len:508 (+),score=46.76 gb/GEZJ01003231.1/:353-1876(+)
MRSTILFSVTSKNPESGYVHSAFAFGYESQVIRTKIDGSQIPPGALLSFIQRGVNFVEIEQSLVDETKDGTHAMDGVTSLLDVHRCLCNQDFKPPRQLNVINGTSDQPAMMDMDDRDPAVSADRNKDRAAKSNVDVPESDVLRLRGHSSEVFVCAWNPRTSVLATGSGDSSARIWPIPTTFPPPSSASAAAAAQPIVLAHAPERSRPSSLVKHRSNDVTTLDWNPTGTMLATGTYDGVAKVWSETGELKHSLVRHTGPLFSLKWNKKGNHILIGSVDKTTTVWNGLTGQLVRQYTAHEAPCLDVDWKDDVVFASCSTDKLIYMQSVESNTPLRVYRGHEDEINCIKFDPSGKLLASCSDDYTAKVWSTESQRMVCNLTEHTREVYTMQWCPSANRRLVLATASFDAMVKLWDVSSGRCMKTLTGHTDPVYSLAYSPDGQFLVSGSFDRTFNIWSVKDGTLVRRFSGDGGIFEVSWNSVGDKIAACFGSNTVCVVDLRKMLATTVKAS